MLGDHDITWTTNAGFIYGNYNVQLKIFKNGILISNDVIYQGVLEGVGNRTFFDIYL
jgi:hypothetical protein